MNQFFTICLLWSYFLIVGCSSSEKIVITCQKLRSTKYDYPKGLTIKGFEHELNEEQKGVKDSIVLHRFFTSDTIADYGFILYFRLRSSFVDDNKKCFCREDIVTEYMRNYSKQLPTKTKQEVERVKDSIAQEINWVGRNDVIARIIYERKTRNDTFYMSEVYYSYPPNSAYHLMYRNKCDILSYKIVKKIREQKYCCQPPHKQNR